MWYWLILYIVSYKKIKYLLLFVIVEFGFNTFHIVCFCIVYTISHEILFDISFVGLEESQHGLH